MNRRKWAIFLKKCWTKFQQTTLQQNWTNDVTNSASSLSKSPNKRTCRYGWFYLRGTTMPRYVMSPPGKRPESNNNLASHRSTRTSQPWPLALILHDHGLWSRPFAGGRHDWGYEPSVRVNGSYLWYPGRALLRHVVISGEREQEYGWESRTSEHDSRIAGICSNRANYSWHLEQMEFCLKFPALRQNGKFCVWRVATMKRVYV